MRPIITDVAWSLYMCLFVYLLNTTMSRTDRDAACSVGSGGPTEPRRPILGGDPDGRNPLWKRQFLAVGISRPTVSIYWVK